MEVNERSNLIKGVLGNEIIRYTDFANEYLIINGNSYILFQTLYPAYTNVILLYTSDAYAINNSISR